MVITPIPYAPSHVRQIHCLAAEPDACFLRISVSDDGQDVAYETMMLSHLRSGVRSLELRSGAHGTRIELCSLLLDVTFNPDVEYTMAQVSSHGSCGWRRLMTARLKMLDRELDGYLDKLDGREPQPGEWEGELAHHDGEDKQDSEEPAAVAPKAVQQPQ